MKLTTLEQFVYVCACILSLGFYWVIKIVIKKAVMEANAKDSK